ncbi:MAG: HAMP domain-containing protein [Alphaproteobacteria bacterium]|nr:HAMP domain-containing protein [Alphaproteobacteria bacterium]
MTTRSMSMTAPSTATSSGCARNSEMSTTLSTPSRPSTASDIATTKSDGGGGNPVRELFASRIARSIFGWNFVGFCILAIGLLAFSEVRSGLTDAQIRSLRLQGDLITNVLIETATIPGEVAPQMNEPAVRQVILRLLPPQRDPNEPRADLRVQVLQPDGTVVADTDVLYGKVDREALPPPQTGDSREAENEPKERDAASSWRITPWRATTSDEEARRRALLGEITAGQRLNDRGERVVAVTIPLRRVQAVIGMVVLESADAERILANERRTMTPIVLAAFAVIGLSSILLALVIAQPLRRLAQAADRLRLTGATRLHLPDIRKHKDEIGDLANALEAMTNALADRIDANERFAADVSHEIKNPLASIRSALDTARAIKDPAQQARLLGIAATDVNRLDRLVTDISRASRIETETARGDLDPVNLGKLLSDLAQSYAAAPGEAQGARVSLDHPIPMDAIVRGQEGPLGQVFRNLIDNARSFSPPAGMVTVSLNVMRVRDGGVARASVSDEGPGIPPDNLETIFDRFYTDRPKGAAFGGNSGLGLSIARQIVTAHGGRIWAENRDGGGARLVVELPLNRPGRARPEVNAA